MSKKEYLEVYEHWKAHFDHMPKEELQILMLHRSRMSSISLWGQFMENVLARLKEEAAERREAAARKQAETKELNQGELH